MSVGKISSVQQVSGLQYLSVVALPPETISSEQINSGKIICESFVPKPVLESSYFSELKKLTDHPESLSVLIDKFTWESVFKVLKILERRLAGKEVQESEEFNLIPKIGSNLSAEELNIAESILKCINGKIDQIALTLGLDRVFTPNEDFEQAKDELGVAWGEVLSFDSRKKQSPLNHIAIIKKLYLRHPKLFDEKTFPTFINIKLLKNGEKYQSFKFNEKEVDLAYSITIGGEIDLPKEVNCDLLLCQACMVNEIKIANQLLDRMESFTDCAIEISVVYGCFDLFRMLVEKSKLDKEKFIALFTQTILYTNDRKFLQTLLEKYPNFKDEKLTLGIPKVEFRCEEFATTQPSISIFNAFEKEEGISFCHEEILETPAGLNCNFSLFFSSDWPPQLKKKALLLIYSKKMEGHLKVFISRLKKTDKDFLPFLKNFVTHLSSNHWPAGKKVVSECIKDLEIQNQDLEQFINDLGVIKEWGYIAMCPMLPPIESLKPKTFSQNYHIAEASMAIIGIIAGGWIAKRGALLQKHQWAVWTVDSTLIFLFLFAIAKSWKSADIT